MKKTVLRLCRFAAIFAVPCILFFSLFYMPDQMALYSVLIILLALVPFFLEFENASPRPRDMVPIVVMSVLAAVGRVLFLAFPNFAPSSAIIIIGGMVFGPQSGFLIGALTAFGSNVAIGQGMWTPWQMYTWGMMGYLAGYLSQKGLLKNRWAMLTFGGVSSLLYGWFLNLWTVVGFLRPLTPAVFLGAYIASIPFDLSHMASTVVFLAVLQAPWSKKLSRIKQKYGLISN